MTITVTELTSNYDNTDATSYSIASTSPAANSLLLLCYTTRHGTTAPGGTPGSDTFGGSWSELGGGEQVDGISAVGAWVKQLGGSPGSSGITLSMDGGVTAIGASWHLLQCTDIDSGTPTLNFTYGPTGSTGTTASVTSQPAMSDPTNNAQVFYSHHRANEAHTPEGTWVAGTSRSGTAPNMGHNVGWKIASEDTTATATWTTSVRWQSFYLELKRAAAAAAAAPYQWRRNRDGGLWTLR